MSDRKPTSIVPKAAIILGMMLIVSSAAPTTIGMLRGFGQLQRGERLESVNSGVELALHPAFMAMGAAGMILVLVGVVLAIWRNWRIG